MTSLHIHINVFKYWKHIVEIMLSNSRHVRISSIATSPYSGRVDRHWQFYINCINQKRIHSHLFKCLFSYNNHVCI